MVCDMLKHDGCRALICIFAAGYQPFMYEKTFDTVVIGRFCLC